MLWACSTVMSWSMIQPSNAGSHGTHGVEKPQPCTGCCHAFSSTIDQMRSRPVRSESRPTSPKNLSRNTHSDSRPPNPTTA